MTARLSMTDLPPALRQQAAASIGRPAKEGPKAARREEAMHMQIVKTLRVLLPPHVTFFHVPNGGKRSKAEAARLKAMGTRAGVPDLIFIHQGRFLGIELKTEDGRLSPEQDRCIADLMLAGADVDVCRSLDAVLARLAAWGIPMKGEVT